MIIKVCGITEERNHQEISRLPVDMIGINFYKPSKRYIGDRTLSVVEGQQRVGVFVQASIESIREAIIKHQLDFAQLHGDESADYCFQVVRFIPVIKVFRIDDQFDWSNVDSFKGVRYFLFDTKSKMYGGTGRKFNWEQLNQYNGSIPFLLSGGIGPEDANTIKELKHPQFAGVDLNSQFEKSPGIKNDSKIHEFIKQLNINC